MKKSTPKSPSSKTIIYWLAAVAMVLSFSGMYMYQCRNTHLYKFTFKKPIIKDDDGNDALGMAQYFFNARKNSVTGKMDYAAMQRSESAIQQYTSTHRATSSGLGLTWTSMGPTNVGGRTRAILFDNKDPSGNTMFAAAVSGGIWKSTDAGASWSPVNDNMQSLEASCLAQDANGNIYCGTGEGFSVFSGGEGFSTALIGGGIFVSKDDGATFQVLPKTIPTILNDSIDNNMFANWSYVNRIAISPCNPNIIYAATSTGIYISKNAGASWQSARNNTNHGAIGGNAEDVKISNDGNVVVASINGTGYIQNIASCGTYDTIFININQGKLNHKLGVGYRIEFAISPTNSNYIYASIADGAGAMAGVYMSQDAGNTWYIIGPGGSPGFDPFAEGGGAPAQGTYDNIIAVFPNNPGEILLGGTTFWFWQNKPNDTVGSWENITQYGEIPDGPGVHPDEHAVAFNPAHPQIAYIGCDGGIFQTLNIDTLTSNTPGFPNWNPMNRNYVTTQFYSVAFAPFEFLGSQNGVAVIGGTQDNGTPYIPGTVSQYPQDQLLDASGGDGGGCAISYIDPAVGFTSVHYGQALLRITTAPSFANFYTTTKGLGKGGNIDSISGQAAYPGSFVPPVALYENMYDKNTIDSIRWIADSNYQAGRVVYPISPNGLSPISFTLPKAMNKGDSIMVQNIVVSKFATAFTGVNGVWMNMQPADLSDPVIWMPIGGPDSKPVAFTDGNPVHTLAWSPDGDALFAGTQDGVLFSFSNLNQIRDTSYLNGALWSLGGSGPVKNPLCRVLSNNIGGSTFSGRDILSITFNPNDENDAIVTLGNYEGATVKYVYYTTNALSVSPLPTWTGKQGTGSTALPQMPVYSASYALKDGGSGNAVVVGTEHGVWSTQNITAANPVWSRDNNGAPNTLVLAIHQQNTPTWLCSNSGNLYMGTHGRGIWMSNSLGVLGVPPVQATETDNDLKIYPNPMNISGTVQINLAKEDNLIVTVYDLTGRAVQSMQLGTQAAGEHLIPLSVSNYRSGVYIVNVTGNNYHRTGRFVVVQ